MRTIVVDDEINVLKSFRRLSAGIDDINIVGTFLYPEEALMYALDHPVDLAVLDIEMPGMQGMELAKKLKELRPEVLIVFITAYENYVREYNLIGADDYIVKPYSQEMIENMAKKMKLLSKRQQKDIFIQMFGRFVLFYKDQPISIGGKPKEILALIATQRGKELSNGEIYSTIWEGRPYGNTEMKVYYNAMRRLRDILEANGISDLLISTSRGQMLNTNICDCDYYAWQDKNPGERDKFEGEFLREYSWGEYILANILGDYM